MTINGDPNVGPPPNSDAPLISGRLLRAAAMPLLAIDVAITVAIIVALIAMAFD